MSSPTPRVFISATTGDLASARRAAVDAVLKQECLPVEQTDFPPEAGTVGQMLEEKIKRCDVVIHMAGFRYGAEPRDRKPEEQRRSYTQMEFDVAQRLSKPVYRFLMEKSFPFDEAPDSEDEERKKLQLKHREALQKGNHLYYPIRTEGQLREKLRELQILANYLRQRNSWLHKVYITGLIALVLVTGVAWTRQRPAIEKDAERQRELAADVQEKAKAAESSGVTDPAAAFQQSVRQVAAERKATPGEVARQVMQYDVGIATNRFATQADKDLASQLRGYSAFFLSGPMLGSGIDETMVRMELERKEKQRQSFGQGLYGPLTFVSRFVMYVSTPPEMWGAARRMEHKENLRQAKAASGGPLIDPATGKLKRFDPDDYILKPGEKRSSPDEAKPLWMTAEHWSTSLDWAWEDTWGVGAGNYRVGFIFGIALLVIALAGRQAGNARYATRPQLPLRTPATEGAPPTPQNSP